MPPHGGGGGGGGGGGHGGGGGFGGGPGGGFGGGFGGGPGGGRGFGGPGFGGPGGRGGPGGWGGPGGPGWGGPGGPGGWGRGPGGPGWGGPGWGGPGPLVWGPPPPGGGPAGPFALFFPIFIFTLIFVGLAVTTYYTWDDECSGNQFDCQNEQTDIALTIFAIFLALVFVYFACAAMCQRRPTKGTAEEATPFVRATNDVEAQPSAPQVPVPVVEATPVAYQKS